MKTHYCHIDRGHEGDPMTYYSRTACGLEECESDMSDSKDDITCKNCLKAMNRAKARTKCNVTKKDHAEIF